MLIQLGNFQFSISTLSYNEIERISTFKFAAHSVIGSYDRLQAVGIDNEILRITGNFFADLTPLVGERDNPFDTLRAIANEQNPLQLQSEDGKNHGYWVIYDLNTRGSRYIHQGSLRSEFTVQLKFYSRRLSSNEPAPPIIRTPLRANRNSSRSNSQLLSQIDIIDMIHKDLSQKSSEIEEVSRNVLPRLERMDSIIDLHPSDIGLLSDQFMSELESVNSVVDSIDMNSSDINLLIDESQPVIIDIKKSSSEVSIEAIEAVEKNVNHPQQVSKQVKDIQKRKALLDHATSQTSRINSRVKTVNSSISQKNRELRKATQQLSSRSLQQNLDKQLIKSDIGSSMALTREVGMLSRQSRVTSNSLKLPVIELKRQQRILSNYLDVIPS